MGREGAKIMSNATPNRDNGAPDPLWDSYTPPRIVTTGKRPAAFRMPIFYVDDREYTAPRRVSAPAAIRALEITAKLGPEAGTWHMVEASLEPEAIKQLKTCEHMTYEDAQNIMTQLGRLYYGQMQAMGPGK